MKRIFSIVLLAIAVPSFLAGQRSDKAAEGAGGTEQEIKKVITQVREAQVKGDTAALERFLADDYTFTNPNGEVMTKRQTMSEHKAGDIKFQTLKMDDVQVRLYGGDTAIATGHVDVKGERKGQDITGQYRATWVLVKNQGRWQPVAAQSTRIDQERMAGSNKPTAAKPKPKAED